VATSKETTRRRYPRAQAQLKAIVRIADNPKTHFEATLRTVDIGVGGVFFESTFFLKLGQRVDVELDLPPHNRHVHCRGRVLRIEQLSERGRSRSGLAIKFDEYVGQSEVILANYFLGPVLRRYVSVYAKQNRLNLRSEETERFLDLLAGWELWKTTLPAEEIWGAPE